MGSDRLNTISYLLNTALNLEEEYLYDGEMSSYVRTYPRMPRTSWTASFEPHRRPLRKLVCASRRSPTRNGSNAADRKNCYSNSEKSRPILDALAGSPDPQLRIFALETGRASPRSTLLSAPIREYRAKPPAAGRSCRKRAGCSPSQPRSRPSFTMPLIWRIAFGEVPALRCLIFCAGFLPGWVDPSPLVRTEAANVVLRWAAEVGEETLDKLLEREDNPTAREMLALARATDVPTMNGDAPALNDTEEQG